MSKEDKGSGRAQHREKASLGQQSLGMGTGQGSGSQAPFQVAAAKALPLSGHRGLLSTRWSSATGLRGHLQQDVRQALLLSSVLRCQTKDLHFHFHWTHRLYSQSCPPAQKVYFLPCVFSSGEALVGRRAGGRSEGLGFLAPKGYVQGGGGPC